MSLIILIQNAMYLTLLICLLCELMSANEIINMYVQQNGIDQPDCIERSEAISCHTLSYVLNQINNTNNEIITETQISVYVYITYNQEITNLSDIQLLVDLYLIGVDNPILKFSRHYSVLSFQGGGLLYAENITFYNFIMSFDHLVAVSFYMCIFTNGGRALTDKEGLYILNIYDLVIRSCLFYNNYDQLELISISQIVYIKISGCEFYQNKGQNLLITMYSFNPFILEMDDCTFYDNNAILTTIDMDGYNTVESIIILTNCLFSNNTSGGKILFITINRLYMSNINLLDNTIRGVENSIIRVKAISYNEEIYSNISNIKFINNTGTGLRLTDLTVLFNNVTFYNNSGVYGGGMSLYHTRIYLIGPLRFEKNKALFGGAIYIAKNAINAFQSYCTTLEQIAFFNNIASMFGDDVFIEEGGPTWSIPFSTFPCINKTKTNYVIGDHIASGPYNITINPQSNSIITLFPGQKLTYSAEVTDYFGNLTSCPINILLQCGVHLVFCKQVKLNGDVTSLLSTSNITTNLYLTSTVEHRDSPIKLLFVCLNGAPSAYANVNLTTCPLGYVFHIPQNPQPRQGTCECVDTANNDVQCDFVLGVACIRQSYWLGKINVNNETHNETAPCQYPYCKTDLPPCPIIGLSQTYKKLPVAQDEQCNGLYGGLLCRSCKEDAVFSFEIVKCIPSSYCEPWQPYVILVFVVVFQLVLGFGIVMGLKSSFKTGVGHLYGPLFFIAVLRLVNFGYYTEYIQLKVTVSIFQSILLLNLEVFGEIPWCFFSNINPLLNYTLHFVGPLMIAVVLLSTVLLARYYPRQFLLLQSSPIQAICLLILLSFWSVSDTCIQLLKPTTTLRGVKEWRVALQPNIEYLKDPYHIVTWIISTGVLLFLLVPLITLLFLSPLLRRKFNLTRIQPLLDAFQSCYDDKYRWYSGVYLLSWIILNINMPYYVMEIILVGVGTIHFIIQPYKYRWLNIVDTLLLVDLNMFVFLTSIDSSNSIHKATVSISYILVVLPLTYIAIGGVGIISVIIIKWCKSKMSARKRTNDEEMINLLEEEKEEIVDSGDRDIHDGVNSTVLERPVCRRESLIFDDN